MFRISAYLILMACLIPALLPDRSATPRVARSLTAVVVEPAPVLPVGPVSLADALASPSLEPVALTYEEAQVQCLAQAIYFEARSEPLDGQLGVAQVVLNRVESPRFPDTVCGVVFQNDHMRNRCQFSFACDGLSDNPRKTRAWDMARRISTIAAAGRVYDVTDDATHYHADYVDPYWRYKLTATVQLGRHMFYRDSRS